MGNLDKNIKLMMESLKVTFFVLHFLFTGIDSWVQPSLKLGFNWVLKPNKPR